MRPLPFAFLTALTAALSVGCAEELDSPTLTLVPELSPAVACSASGDENAALQTRVVVRAAAGSSFAPLPVGTRTPDASLALPTFTLRGEDNTEIPVRRVELSGPRDAALWITATTADGRPVPPGRYAVVVTAVDGSRAQTPMGTLRVTAPPTVTAATRVEPAVPAAGVDPAEPRTLCNTRPLVLSVTGTGFRPMEPAPRVEVLDEAGAVVRALDEGDVRVVSATELRVTVRTATGRAPLAPGRYGLRVTNPDGVEAMAGAGQDGGVRDASVTLQGTTFPQGCRATGRALFTVVAPPELRAVEAVSACASRENTFVLRGAHLRRGVVVTVGSTPPYTVPAANVAYMGPAGAPEYDALTLTVPPNAIPAGNGYTVRVANPDGCEAALEPTCPAGTFATGAPNECYGMVGAARGPGARSLTLYPDPTVTSVAPRGQCATRLRQVTVTGTNFHSTFGVEPRVTIQNLPAANVRVLSPTTLVADVPESLMAGDPFGVPYEVSVTVPEGCSGAAPRSFTLFPPPTVTAVRPASICGDRPGTQVTVEGTNFHALDGEAPVVTLGSTPPVTLANVRVTSPTTLTADVPAETPEGGPWDVTVATPGGCPATLPRAFTHRPAPAIRSVTAQVTCGAATPTLLISGRSFFSEGAPVAVTLGTTPTPTALTNVRVASSGVILADVPSRVVAGMYSVTVTLPGGCSAATLPQMFVPAGLTAPTLAAVAPARGWNDSDLRITVTGAGVAALTGLALRGASSTGGDLALTDLTVLHGDALVATVPAGARAGGPYDLVSTTAGCATTLARAYTIAEGTSLTLTSVSPASVPTTRDADITLEGAGFTSTPRAWVLTPLLTPRIRALLRVAWVSPTRMRAAVPAGLPIGSYDVIVVNPDGAVGRLREALRVTLRPPPEIDAVSPEAGATQGATRLTIRGRDFRSPEVRLVGATGVTVTVVSATATRIVATVPAGVPTGTWPVRVTNPDEATSSDGGPFTVGDSTMRVGAFSAGPSLVTARRGVAVVSSRRSRGDTYLYAIGGDGGSGALATVESARVGLDGRLDAWREQRYRLPQGITNIANAVVEHEGYLYVLGGTNAAGAAQDGVLRARVLDADTAPLLLDPTVTRIRGGGLSAGAWTYRVAAVMASTDADNPNGETLSSAPVTAFVPISGAATLRWGSVPGAASYRVYRAPTANSATGDEVLLATVAAPRVEFTDDGSATTMPAALDTRPLAEGSTGAWSVLPSTLRAARAATAAVIGEDSAGSLYLYALAGSGPSGALDSWEGAALSADGATLSPFVAGPTRLTLARSFAAAASTARDAAPGVTDGEFVYLTGGFGEGNAVRATEVLRVGPGGVLVTPREGATYADRRGAPGARVVNGALYVFAGAAGPALASTGLGTVTVSPIAATGSPGMFTTAAALLSTVRGNFGLGLAGARFYVVGGSSSGSEALATVEQTTF